MQREGVFREMKCRRFYEKPSEKSNREKLTRSVEPTSSLARRPNARDLSLRCAGRRCRGAERPGVARSRSRVEFRLGRDGVPRRGSRGAGTNRMRQLSSLLVAKAPKLKAFRIDRFLDRS